MKITVELDSLDDVSALMEFVRGTPAAISRIQQTSEQITMDTQKLAAALSPTPQQETDHAQPAR